MVTTLHTVDVQAVCRTSAMKKPDRKTSLIKLPTIRLKKYGAFIFDLLGGLCPALGRIWVANVLCITQ